MLPGKNYMKKANLPNQFITNMESFEKNWARYLDGALTICDKEGIILFLNPISIKNFEKDGGANLIGTNLLDCHPEPSKSQLKSMLKNEGRQTYTSEKNGRKRLFHQFPWYEDGVYGGLMEFSILLPEDMKNYKR